MYVHVVCVCVYVCVCVCMCVCVCVCMLCVCVCMCVCTSKEGNVLTTNTFMGIWHHSENNPTAATTWAFQLAASNGSFVCTIA